MSTSTNDTAEWLAESVDITDEELIVQLDDGRTIIVPLAWFPRLTYGTAEERKTWRLIGRGQGIHWPELDEDISVANLLNGRPASESQRSFKRWLQQRTKKTAGSPSKKKPGRHKSE